jgi:hypothetical protein
VARKKDIPTKYVATDRTKTIARAFASAIGSRPEVHVFEADHFQGMRLAILFAPAWPSPQMNTAVTLDLADDPPALHDVGYEFYLVARPGWDIERVLGEVGVRVRRQEIVPAPLEFIDGGMGPRYENLRVKHLIAMDPPIVPLPIEMPALARPIQFLQLVPYTDGEKALLETGGRPAIWASLRARKLGLLDFGRG